MTEELKSALDLKTTDQVKLLIKCAEAYYAGKKTKLSDDDFDYLEESVMGKLNSSPNKAYSNALLKKIHFPTLSSPWIKEKHKIAMGSQNKISPNSPHTKESFLSDINYEPFVAEEKLDGISLSSEYEIEFKNGKLVKALMRDKGIAGSNIYNNARFFKCLPQILPHEVSLSIRGEVIITKEDFDAVNKLKVDAGEDEYTALRNAAAGIAAELNGTYVKYLTFIAYDVEGETLKFSTQLGKLEYLESIGCQVVKSYLCRNLEDLEAIEKEYIETKRYGLNYLIDGLVLKLNDLRLASDLDEAGKNPRSQIALKFPAEARDTETLDITWQVGKRRYTPVMELKKVKICGVNVRRATLHNVDRFNASVLCKGDTVSISRNGDVIPYFNHVVCSNGGERFIMPTKCTNPECGHPLIIKGAYLECSNDECGDKKVGDIVNWFEKLGYKGVAKGTITKVYNSLEDVNSIMDFYLLDTESLMTVDRMAGKSADNFVDAITSKLDIPFASAVGSLNIENLSISNATKLINGLQIDSIEKLKIITVEQMMSLDGFGETAPKTLRAILDRVHILEELHAEFDEFLDFSIQKIEGDSLKDKAFCFTGASSIGRKKLEMMVKKNGGRVGGVNGKLNYLVSSDGVKKGKYNKAESMGIPVITEEAFLEMVEGE